MSIRSRSRAADSQAVWERLSAITGRGWVPSADAVSAPNAVEVEVKAEEPEQDFPGWVQVDAEGLPTGRHAATPAGRLARLLPPGLRTVRLDPGRRGAAVVIAVAVAAALLTGLVMWHSRPVAQAVDRPAPSAIGTLPAASPGSVAPTSASSAATVVVAVAGKVRHPGIVRLPAGSRVADAIKAAGGVRPGASAGLLNLARVLVDGEQVVVGVTPPAGGGVTGGVAGSSESSAPVSINTGTAEQLDTLPGIGPSTAQRIIEYRTKNGPFTGIEQLQDVSGIGPAKYAQLVGRVTL